MQVVGSAKSSTMKNQTVAKPAPGKAERSVGKKERRPSHSQEQADDEELKPWNTAQRPAGSATPQDNSFCIEDESTSQTVESLMYSFTISDPQQKGNPLVFVSPGFETLTGYSSEELLGANCRVLQGKTPEKEKATQLSQGIKERLFTSVELTNYRKDGKAFQNLLCVLPFFDAYDNLLKFVGVQCDLDDKKRRDHVDEHFTTKWQEQIHHYLTAFMLLDNSHDSAPITAVSPGFTALTGYSQADVLGCSCLCMSGPDSNVKALKKWVTSQWADKPVAVKVLSYRKDGSPFWAYVFSCPLTVGRGTSAKQTLCLMLDITSSRLKRVGKYVLGKVIGSGAYGIVRLGKIPGTDEVVAIKSVDASRFRSISEIEQIQEEMNVLSSLKHPNIIKLIEIHFVNQIFFMVMEFASGGSLIKYIRSHPGEKLPEAEAHRIFSQIVSGLDYCHRRRVIHRDLKPENILMDDRNNIKIADFGLAAVAAPFGKGLTQQCGTPEFTAPEITTGKEYDGPSVDVWSMGVILYESLTGNLPFTGATTAALFKAIQRGVYTPLPPEISPKCCNLIKGMLRVNTHTRLTMDEISNHPWCRGAADGDGDGDAYDLAGESEYDMPDDDDPLLMSGPHSNRTLSAGQRSVGRRRTEGPEDEDSRGILSGDGASLSRGISSDYGWVEGPRGSSRGLTQSGAHDSVRLVFDGDAHGADDPITAAIMRAQLATMSILGSTTSAERSDMRRSSIDRGAVLDMDDLGAETTTAVKGSATSFSRTKALGSGAGVGRDNTPTRREAPGTGINPARVAMANARRKGETSTMGPGGPLPPLLGGNNGNSTLGSTGRRATLDAADSKPISTTSVNSGGSMALRSGTSATGAAPPGSGSGKSSTGALGSMKAGSTSSSAAGEFISARRNLPPITKVGSSNALNKMTRG